MDFMDFFVEKFTMKKPMSPIKKEIIKKNTDSEV